jgi:hypothetical protein
MVNINQFDKECPCVYKDEHYSVRNNGAVLRHTPINKRIRHLDNNWTFGKLNTITGYLEIASVRIHRIIATAFHGEPPTKEHVVDHIDTNKQNNRPENLRWVTRLENILLNPITARRIEIVCGSVEAFLEDPSKFKDKFKDPNYEWMCSVSKVDAQLSLERLTLWSKSYKPIKGGSLGKWIFYRENEETQYNKLPNYIKSKTINAAQRIVFNFEDKPNEYPSTPEKYEGDPLTAYKERLKEGVTFFRNHNGEYVVVKSGFSKDKKTLYVMTKAAYLYCKQEDGDIHPVPLVELPDKISDKDLTYSLAEVIFEDDLFIHGRAENDFHPTEELEKIFNDYTQ